MKRERGHYNRMELYPEGIEVKNRGYLNAEEGLVFAVLYNLTGKGKNRLMSDGKHSGVVENSFNTVCRDNCQKLDVRVSLINKEWLHRTLDILESKNYIKRLNDVTIIDKKGVDKHRRDYILTSHALKVVKKVEMYMKGESSSKALF
jgi:hypothetical protein